MLFLGSMCHSVFDPGTMLAGASGGCYSLIGAHYAIVIMVCIMRCEILKLCFKFCTIPTFIYSDIGYALRDETFHLEYLNTLISSSGCNDLIHYFDFDFTFQQTWNIVKFKMY